MGRWKVSLIHIEPADLAKVPADVLVYSRNGVQATPATPSQRELGLIVETSAKTREAAILLDSLLNRYLIHYGCRPPQYLGLRRPSGTSSALSSRQPSRGS